jgi:hypothetical protein
MGLDMYLDKKLRISEYDYDQNDKTLVDKVLKLIEVEDKSENYKHITISVPAIYWRKSNQIHRWFVDNCQGGVDDCREVEVEVKQLENLLNEIQDQLNHKDKITLKPQGGFFFGNTEIDEWYWADLERSKEGLKREIDFQHKEQEKKRYWEFTYQSSW